MKEPLILSKYISVGFTFLGLTVPPKDTMMFQVTTIILVGPTS